MAHDTGWHDTLTLTMDQFFAGTGWYGVERAGDAHCRWTGPGTVATVHVHPRRDRSNRVNIIIESAMAEHILAGMHIEADGRPLPLSLSTRRNPAFVSAVLPENPAMVEGEATVLSIAVPETVHPPGSADTRTLGLRVQQITIFPVARELFSRQKADDPTPFDGLQYLRINPVAKSAVQEGIYKSAYEYHLIKGRHDPGPAPDLLHAHFDERPGDLYDLAQAEMESRFTRVIAGQEAALSVLQALVSAQHAELCTLRKRIQSISK